MDLHGTIKNKEILDSMSPAGALQLLKEGNRRFLNKNPVEREHFKHIRETVKGQYPFAIILSCIDSRVIPELIFDQGIGDLFVARIAGNIINRDILGSMEYACAVSGAKLIVVMGHTACGAVKGAIDNVKLGNLTRALEPVKPAIEKAADGFTGVPDSANQDFVNKVAGINVHNAIARIKQESPVLNALLKEAKIEITGAMYDHTTGKVTFYEK